MYDVVAEAHAGRASSFPDAADVEVGARVLEGDSAWAADTALKIAPPTATKIDRLADGTTMIGLLYPAPRPELVQ